MKIVRIIARLNVGGPARHVIWLTKALQTAEFQSVLLTGKVPAGEEDMSAGAISFRYRDGKQRNGVPISDAIIEIETAIRERRQV